MAEAWRIPVISVREDGETFFTERTIQLSPGGGANSIGALSSMFPASGVMFRETPSDYLFEWHCAPRRQFIVNLNAAVHVETSNGDQRLLPAGQVFFVEDIHGKGHRSKAVDGQTRLSVFIAVPDDCFRE
eukprot:TRINITY_DN15380_c0_g1_i1.p2 TRINITY_DN15380_c0_g1~~TRINITY_DN15380_c0_g1_i1.p2  ORF type:complete len:130 (-),score=25.98 TRINITY_DN15380_c0_g1_i1:7-396(-)